MGLHKEIKSTEIGINEGKNKLLFLTFKCSTVKWLSSTKRAAMYCVFISKDNMNDNNRTKAGGKWEYTVARLLSYMWSHVSHKKVHWVKIGKVGFKTITFKNKQEINNYTDFLNHEKCWIFKNILSQKKSGKWAKCSCYGSVRYIRDTLWIFTNSLLAFPFLHFPYPSQTLLVNHSTCLNQSRPTQDAQHRTQYTEALDKLLFFNIIL